MATVGPLWTSSPGSPGAASSPSLVITMMSVLGIAMPMQLPCSGEERQTSSGARYVERNASVRPYIRKIFVPEGLRRFLSSSRLAWGILPPVLARYRRCVRGFSLRDFDPLIRSAHNGGTPVAPVISCLRRAFKRSPGSLERSKYNVAPARREVVNWLIPASKFRGRAERMRSSGVFFRYVVTICAPTTRLRWLVATPLGIPVDPEVYRMVPRSDSETLLSLLRASPFMASATSV